MSRDTRVAKLAAFAVNAPTEGERAAAWYLRNKITRVSKAYDLSIPKTSTFEAVV